MAVGAYVVTGLSAGFLAYTRSVCAAYFCGAALGCALSVKVIKKFVRQPRPPGVTTLKSYGYELYHPFIYCALRESETLHLFVLIVCLAHTLPSCSSTLARWCSPQLRYLSTLHSLITPAFAFGPQFWRPHLPLWSLCLGSGGATMISSRSRPEAFMGLCVLSLRSKCGLVDWMYAVTR